MENHARVSMFFVIALLAGGVGFVGGPQDAAATTTPTQCTGNYDASTGICTVTCPGRTQTCNGPATSQADCDKKAAACNPGGLSGF
jgi:hypothetical protein